MSGTNTQANVPTDNESPDLPVAAIVCLSVGGYVLLVCAFLVIKRMLVAKGYCQSQCCSCQGDTCCIYCAKLSQACPCCCTTSSEGCLSTVCGKRKRTNCVDILLCNCCGCTEQLCECLGIGRWDSYISGTPRCFLLPVLSVTEEEEKDDKAKKQKNMKK